MTNNDALAQVTSNAIEDGIKAVEKAAMDFQHIALTTRGYQFKSAYGMMNIKKAFNAISKKATDKVVIDGIECAKWWEYVIARFNIGKSTAEAAVKLAENFCLEDGSADETKTHYLSYSALNNMTVAQIETAYQRFTVEILTEQRGKLTVARDNTQASDEVRESATALLALTDSELLQLVPPDRTITLKESIDISFSRLPYTDIKRLVKGEPKQKAPNIPGGNLNATDEPDIDEPGTAEPDIKETAEQKAYKAISNAITILSNNFKYITDTQKQALRELLAKKK